MRADALVARGNFVVPVAHPSLPGHFPGQPVVPGVVLLDHALALLVGAGAMSGLEAVKFTAAVLPGQAVELWSGPVDAAGRMRFSARVGALEVLRGTVRARAP